MIRTLIAVLIFSLTLSMFHTYVQKGFPYTNDGENHLARIANYKIALKEGQFPPRFAPNLMNHYGYPVFNYNYPLINILSVPFSFLRFNPELTFKIISVSFFVFGLAGIYALLRAEKKSLFTIVIAMGLFGTQPYLVNTVLFRGSIGELAAASLLPWVLWSMNTLIRTQKISIFAIGILTSFFLSHNVTVVIALPIIALYSSLQVNLKQGVQSLKPIVISFLLSVGLTLWFWLPALLEADFTVVKEAGIANQFFAHFVTLNELLFGHLGFGFSNPGSIDSLGFQIGMPAVCVVFLAIVILLKSLLTRSKMRLRFVAYFVSTIAILFFQTEASAGFWRVFTSLQIIQFPWRLSILLGTLIPLLWAESSVFISRFMKKVLIFFILLSVAVIGSLRPVDFFHHNQIDYDLFPQSTSTQNENRTKDFTYLEIGDWSAQPRIEGKGDSYVSHWTGSDRKYKLVLQEPSLIIEPTMNFTGWETKIVDESGYISHPQYLRNDHTQGRIAFELLAGTYYVSTFFTQKTMPRIIGNTISLFIFFGILIWMKFNKTRKHV